MEETNKSGTMSIQYLKQYISQEMINDKKISLEKLLEIENDTTTLDSKMIKPTGIKFTRSTQHDIKTALSRVITPGLEIVIDKCDLNSLTDVDFSMASNVTIKNCPKLADLGDTYHNVTKLVINGCKNLCDVTGLKTASKLTNLTIISCNKLASENICYPNTLESLDIEKCSKLQHITLDSHYSINSISIICKSNIHIKISTNIDSKIVVYGCNNIEFIGDNAKKIKIYRDAKTIYLPKQVDILDISSNDNTIAIKSKYDVCDINTIKYNSTLTAPVVFDNNIKLNNMLIFYTGYYTDYYTNSYSSSENILDISRLHKDSLYNIYINSSVIGKIIYLNVKDSKIQNIFLKDVMINIFEDLNIYGDQIIIEKLRYFNTPLLNNTTIQNSHFHNKLRVFILNNIGNYHKHVFSGIVSRLLDPSNDTSFMAPGSIVKLINCVKEPSILYLDPNVSTYIIYDDNITAIKPCPNLPTDTRYNLTTLVLGVQNVVNNVMYDTCNKSTTYCTSKYVKIGHRKICKAKDIDDINNSIPIDKKLSQNTLDTSVSTLSSKKNSKFYIELPNNCNMLKQQTINLHGSNTQLELQSVDDTQLELVEDDNTNLNDDIFKKLIINNDDLSMIEIVNPSAYLVEHGYRAQKIANYIADNIYDKSTFFKY